MQLRPLILICLLAACDPPADAVKTAAQAAADQKAIAVRAVADQKIAAQNEADTLKTAALKAAAVRKTLETSAPVPAASPAVVPTPPSATVPERR